ncbi:hypothetical protein EIP86_001616 [Pleurotus ostreatoroseus]|nr:hypothetical protein EIP86_001616 [Pleurotus ostreatoroseus]
MTSASQTHLAPPAAGSSRPRRMTSPSLPPPSPLDLPEPVVYGQRRPPSPLRTSVTADPETGEIIEGESFSGDEEQDEWGQRPSSPSPSVAKFAANFAHKVGSLMSNMSARSPNHLPTDEELEAEAEIERDRTRREAERILSQEADARRMEERVNAMLHDEMMKLPPPALSTSTPPSPASSNKEGSSWFATVKQKLTPTKEPLTPAQQIIQETKAREKEIEKEGKRLEKERKGIEKEMKKSSKKQVKQKSGEWPSSPEGKFNDPAFLQLNTEPPLPPQPPFLQRPSTPSSPTPAGRAVSTPPSISTPPRSTRDSNASPGRNGPPVYAQFTSDGTLDIAGTLLTVAGRFEELERWTVGHVRALEERMDDVERWLVEKEKDAEQKVKNLPRQQTGEPATVEAALGELRDELAEVQGRIGELGREVAKMVISPGNLSSGPRGSASVGRAPSTSSSVAVRSMSNTFASPPRTASSPNVKDTISPTFTPVKPTTPGTRLPYPTGDYATPPDSVMLAQGPFSPTSSPPASVNARVRQSPIPGLPTPGLDPAHFDHDSLGLPVRAVSPPSLPRPPSTTALRPASVSPTPRKRYTVALGGPIMAADRDRESRPMTPHSRSQSRDFDSGLLSTSPVSTTLSIGTTDDSDSGGNDETIGKAASRMAGLMIPKFKGQEGATQLKRSSPSMSPRPPRPRPQSMYNRNVSSTHNLFAPSPITPLNTRSRSQSTDRFGLPLNGGAGNDNGSDSTASVPPTPTSGKFVDPLEMRRRTKEMVASTAPPAPKIVPGRPKVPVGELVAYFNKEK